MNDKAPAARQFQAEIYRDLDRKLKNTHWNSGASEAHGLLSALACRGISGAQIRSKAWLFQLSEAADIDLLDGMYGLILRDLQSDALQFTLLLADDGFSDAQRIESLTDWCDGFVQGVFHDGWGVAASGDKTRLDGAPERVRESINDIMKISRMSIASATASATDHDATERQLFEIEEYLRVAIQIIFEELNPSPPANPTGIN